MDPDVVWVCLARSIVRRSDWLGADWTPHLFLSSESTTICLFFCGDGESSSFLWRTDTFSRVVTLVTVAMTECVISDCAVVTASEIWKEDTHT